MSSLQSTTSRSVVEAYCEAWMAGDAMAVVSLYHQDLVLIWPGSHQLAGVHDGLTAAVEALMSLQTLTNRVPTEIRDVLENGETIVVTVIERWTDPNDPDHTMNVARDLEYTVADEKLRTCLVRESDQAAVDGWIEAAVERVG